MQQKKEQQSIAYQQTTQKFHLQLNIIKKIMTSHLSRNINCIPSIIIYQISTFVFQNPLRLKQLMYYHWTDRTLKLNQKFLVKGRVVESKGSCSIAELQNSSANCQKSAFITIGKQWKALDTSNYGYAQVILKGKLFLNFLSNIKIKAHPQVAIDYDPLNDYNAFQKQEKEKSKHYTLISDNLNLILKQFQEIFQYEKDKKISDVLIKAFTSLMGKNMAIVRIEENYNTKAIGCEGKYIYVANKHQLPFMKNEHRTLTEQVRKHVVADFPWMQMDKNGEWKLCHWKHHGVNLYRQQLYPLKRRRKWLINKQLEYFIQEDVWITHA